MEEIIYTEHLKLRVKLREIPDNYPEIIYKNPDQHYYDTVEKTSISIKNLHYNNKIRPMMIAYEKGEGTAHIITIHPISEESIRNRVTRGRWTKT